ncbi:cytochrome P450 [Nocardia carnea]|uniref:cytochrome P450 n=1 Tax=Nocardia carnea TaxID=37328 RepID=UPI00245665AF|nr:cytochrome P450 [Nocardia carnea]
MSVTNEGGTTATPDRELSGAEAARAAAGGCPHFAGYDPLSASELRDPHTSFRKARNEFPVYYSERFDLYEVSRQSDILEVLADFENFSAVAALPMITPPAAIQHRLPEYPWTGCVLVQDDPEHRATRALVQSPFTPRRVKAQAEGIRAKVGALLDPLEKEGRIEFISRVANPMAFQTVNDVLGLPAERFDLLERGVDATIALLSGGLTTDAEVLSAAQTCADLYEFVYEFVEERRAHPTDDFTSTIVNTRREDGTLEPTDQALKHVWTLIIAGFETTANALSNGLRSLLTHRDQWNLLLNDRSLLDGAVEEMLRHRALLKRLFRLATNDVVVGGVTIPKGARVALLVASANRDESVVENPDTFDITRKQPHLSFGKGQHFCVGAPLARLEIKIAVETLLDRFPDLAIAEDHEISWLPNPMFDEMTALHLVANRK